MLYLYSNAIPGTAGNFVLGGSGDPAAGKNYMMVGANRANQIRVVGEFQLNGITIDDVTDTLLLGHYCDNGGLFTKYITDTLGSVTQSTDGLSYFIEYVMTDTWWQYNYVKYCFMFEDNDGDGVYTPDGVDVLYPFPDEKFRTVWYYAFWKNYNYLLGQINAVSVKYPLTYSLFQAFLNNGNQSQADINANTFPATPTVESISPNAFGLTHNTGLNWVVPAPGYFAQEPSAQIKRWIIPATGDTKYYAWQALRHDDFVKMVSTTIATHRNDVVKAFAANNTSSIKFTWALPNQISFTTGDFYYAIKEGTLKGMTISVTLDPTALANPPKNRITAVVLNGYLEDLYDFDFDQGGGWLGNPQAAAILQAGYPSISGVVGAVYYLQMNFSGLDMARIQMPDNQQAAPFYGATMDNLPNYP